MRRELLDLADRLAPHQGYNSTRLEAVRILRSETNLHDVPVLYRPGVVFVLQGRKHGMLEGEVYRYDDDHYLAVSLPVPFRMESFASPERPLLAVYIEFDMTMAARLAMDVEQHHPQPTIAPARSLFSSAMEPDIEDTLRRLLKALVNPAEAAILGSDILRELHYRVLVGPQGSAMIAALKQTGASGRIIQSLAKLHEAFMSEISVTALAKEAGMSVPAYHAHFKALTGSSPMQYVKSMRLHEARSIILRQNKTIAEVALSVGYVSPTQFSRDFKRHFRRTASQEAKWALQHLGAMLPEE